MGRAWSDWSSGRKVESLLVERHRCRCRVEQEEGADEQEMTAVGSSKLAGPRCRDPLSSSSRLRTMLFIAFCSDPPFDSLHRFPFLPHALLHRSQPYFQPDLVRPHTYMSRMSEHRQSSQCPSRHSLSRSCQFWRDEGKERDVQNRGRRGRRV